MRLGSLRRMAKKILLSHLNETPKLCIEVYYKISTLALFHDIFSLEILGCPPSWYL